VIGFNGRDEFLSSSSQHRLVAPVIYADERSSKSTHDELTDTEVLLTKAESGRCSSTECRALSAGVLEHNQDSHDEV
jgi:hypothetical protein